MNYQQSSGGSQPGKTIQHSGVCDICGAANLEAIYDGAIIVGTSATSRRVWAWVCPDCFAARDGHLGTGQGQLYRRAK